MTMDELDSIHKQVTIAASAQLVWELIVEPGWYVNDGELREHRLEQRGGITIVHDEVHGAFAFQTVKLDEPTYAAFRWLRDPHDVSTASTLVEFRITEVDGGSVTLSVTESGFASLPGDAAARRREYDGNLDGWAEELAVAKAALESQEVR